MYHATGNITEKHCQHQVQMLPGLDCEELSRHMVTLPQQADIFQMGFVRANAEVRDQDGAQDEAQ